MLGPTIRGVMACARCLTVVAFTVDTDFERHEGNAWQYCPICGVSRCFIPLVPPAQEP